MTSEVLEVDRVIHEPVRLRIVGLLSVVEEADFVFLVGQIGLSAGNAGSHLKKLEEAGYVGSRKGFSGNRPQTMYRLTTGGRRAARRYRTAMAGLLDPLPT